MKKREAQVERDARDAREYNENLRKEYEERDAAGEKSGGSRKSPKRFPSGTMRQHCLKSLRRMCSMGEST